MPLGPNLRVETSPFHMERSFMKIHLRQIPPGGTLHVEGVEDPGFLELEEALSAIPPEGATA